MKIVIVAGGTPPSKQLVKTASKDAAFIIAADGGANCLYDYEIRPDFMVGDFDSIDQKALDFLATQNISHETYPRHKEATDTELALEKAITLGGNEIVFLGATGDRLDHTFGNLGLLRKCLDLNIKASLTHENGKIFLSAATSLKLQEPSGTVFSLQAYNDKVENLSITGSKFELENYTLSRYSTRTISNEFLSFPIEIKFSKGELIIFIYNLGST